jgi:hypothetical protein
VFSIECPVALNHINDLKTLSTEFPEVPIELLFPERYFTESEVEGFMIRYGLIDRLGWRIDRNDEMIRKLGARVMPTAFLVTDDNTIVYQGKINDRPVSLGKVKALAQNRYLANALKAVLSGLAPSIKETEPVGCLLN